MPTTDTFILQILITLYCCVFHRNCCSLSHKTSHEKWSSIYDKAINPLKPSVHYMYSTVVTICTAQWSLYVPHSGHYMYHHL